VPSETQLADLLTKAHTQLNIVFFFTNSIWLIHLEFEGGVRDTYVVYFRFVVSPL
jgi:hypothetical protein